MAKRGRASLAAVDLTGSADNPKAPETERNTQAQTLRLPPRYWRYLQVKAVQRKTTQSGLIKQALDEMMKRDPQPPGFE
jgi:hypothetical protein